MQNFCYQQKPANLSLVKVRNQTLTLLQKNMFYYTVIVTYNQKQGFFFFFVLNVSLFLLTTLSPGKHDYI